MKYFFACQFAFCLFTISILYLSYDYLRITNDTMDVIGTFCGQQTGATVTVTALYVVLTFRTNRIMQRTGFELLFSYEVFPGKFHFLKRQTNHFSCDSG